MKNRARLVKRLRGLLESQRLAVLASHDRGRPHTSLVAFASTGDMKQLVFATARTTRKFANLCADGRVALLVDSRSNREEDFHDAIAATAAGKASEAKGAARARLLKRYLEKHPHLCDFVGSPTCALVRIRVETYYLVQRFQEVTELTMGKGK